MAEEAKTVVTVVGFCVLPCFVFRDGIAIDAGSNSCEAGGTKGIRFGIESDTFEQLTALETAEANWVETLRTSTDDATSDGKSASRALGGSTVGCWRPV